MDKIKIAIIGSCVSRDGFNSSFIRDYKQFYKCVLAQNHMSMISLVANPIPYKPSGLEGDINDFNKQILMTELTKSVWDSLEIHKPDYLILDFYADVYFGIREVGNSYITNKTWLFKKTPFYSTLDLGKTINLDNDYDQYIRLWKESINAFMRIMEIQFPQIKIIVNKVHFTDQFISKETKEIKKISETGKYKKIDVDEVNRRLDIFYNYFEDNFDVEYLQYDKEYYSDENHIWDFFYVHYTRDYYEDFTTKLLNVILTDLYETKKHQRVSVPFNSKINRNLIRNSTFNEDSAYWTYWHNDFVINQPDRTKKKSNIVTINIFGSEEDTNRQLWSNPVEIDKNGKQKYTISFDLKVEDIQKLDGNPIVFSLRTFNKIDQHFQKDSVWYKNIKLADIRTVKNNKWMRVSYTFKPSSGKFLKVGPYLKRNGRVSWRNIKLEKGVNSTIWAPSYKEEHIESTLIPINIKNWGMVMVGKLVGRYSKYRDRASKFKTDRSKGV